MIKKIGNALKTMSQRSMWRGNRADSQAIESHGIHGFRNNMKDGGSDNGPTISSSSSVGGSSPNLIKNTPGKTTIGDSGKKTGLGSSILDSLN